MSVFKNKVAVINGSGDGIGEKFTKRCGAEQSALDWALQYLKLEKSATEYECKKITETSYSNVYKIQTIH